MLIQFDADKKQKKIEIEIYGKKYLVNNGLRNAMRVDKEYKKMYETQDFEMLFDIIDLLLGKGFCDEVEKINPLFPFEDLLQEIIDNMHGDVPEALQEKEPENENEEPKKE